MTILDVWPYRLLCHRGPVQNLNFQITNGQYLVFQKTLEYSGSISRSLLKGCAVVKYFSKNFVWHEVVSGLLKSMMINLLIQ